MTLWVLPVAVVAVAAPVVLVALRRAASEAAALRAELARLAALRGPAEALGVELRHLQAQVARRRVPRPQGRLAP